MLEHRKFLRLSDEDNVWLAFQDLVAGENLNFTAGFNCQNHTKDSYRPLDRAEKDPRKKHHFEVWCLYRDCDQKHLSRNCSRSKHQISISSYAAQQ